MRRTYVSMTWTPGVDQNSAKLLLRTVEDIYELVRKHLGTPGQFDPLPSIRVFGAWAIPSSPPGTPYADIDWMIRRSLDDERDHILATRFVETVTLEPWQSTHPHFDLCLTELPVHDDRAAGSNVPGEVIGISHRGMLSLISTRQFDVIESESLRQLAMQHAFANHIGMLFDIPDSSRTDIVISEDGNIYCANQCAMRYTGTPQKALAFARQEVVSGVIYCEACQHDLIAKIAGYHLGPN
jgi:hypothetical protein